MTKLSYIALGTLLFLCACGAQNKTEETQKKLSAGESAPFENALIKVVGLEDGSAEIQIDEDRIEKAAQDGLPGAQFLYGDKFLQKGEYKLAKMWFERAAKQNMPQAITAIGQIYRNGDGVTKDYQKARQWLERSAALHDVQAMVNLATLHKAYIKGADADIKFAYWFDQAANMGNADALFISGLNFLQGTGMKQNTTVAYLRIKLANERIPPNAEPTADLIARQKLLKKMEDSLPEEIRPHMQVAYSLFKASVEKNALKREEAFCHPVLNLSCTTNSKSKN